MCRDSTGFLYQVLAESSVGTAIPQPGEIWLINRTLGLWSFLARISLPSPITQTIFGSIQMEPTNRFIFGAPPSGTTWSVTLPNPITATPDQVYGIRNTSGGGTGYDGLLTLAPFSTETIHGPQSFGAHSGATFVVGQDPNNVAWFCIGEATTSSGGKLGGS
jgi:hypothetical protein